MANNTVNTNAMVSRGVESLIERLKNDGVEAGRTEADKLIEEAKKESYRILNDARQEANKLITEATQKIQSEKQAALEALKLALRDLRLELRQQLINRFKEEVKRLIHKELDNESTMRQLILLFGLNSAKELQEFKAKNIEIELPEKVLEFDKIRNNPKLLETDSLKQLVQGITSQMLKEELNFKINTENKGEVGIKVRILGEGQDIELDFSEDAMNALLLKHLQPRFRALLEGLLR